MRGAGRPNGPQEENPRGGVSVNARGLGDRVRDGDVQDFATMTPAEEQDSKPLVPKSERQSFAEILALVRS